MKILAIGESIIDNVYGVSDYPTSGIPQDTIPSIHVGGSALSAIIILARLGAQCTFLTTVGKDENAKIILDLLDNEKITVIPNYSEQTKVNIMLVNTRTGVRSKVRGPESHSKIEKINSKFLQQFDAVIIDRHERIAFYEILKKRNKSTQIFIDPSTEVSDFTLDMIKNADYPVIPIEYLENANPLSNTENQLKKLYHICKKPIVVTTGKSGSIIYEGSKIESVPAIAFKPVDVTGAGDVFRGGFAYGMLKGWTLRKSAEFANYVAGMQCTKLGNASAIPTRHEMQEGTKIIYQKPYARLEDISNLDRTKT